MIREGAGARFTNIETPLKFIHNVSKNPRWLSLAGASTTAQVVGQSYRKASDWRFGFEYFIGPVAPSFIENPNDRVSKRGADDGSGRS